MRIVWTLVKVIVGLMVAIPLAIIALGLTLGVVGVALALAVMALKLAIIALVAYGVFRLAKRLFGGKSAPHVPVMGALPEPRDRYYEAAMRELDMEMGPTSRS